MSCFCARYAAENGEMVRPWCPATRLLDQREMDALNAKAEAAKKAGMTDSRFAEKAAPLREGFPQLEASSPFGLQGWCLAALCADKGAGVLSADSAEKVVQGSAGSAGCSSTQAPLLVHAWALGASCMCVQEGRDPL